MSGCVRVDVIMCICMYVISCLYVYVYVCVCVCVCAQGSRHMIYRDLITVSPDMRLNVRGRWASKEKEIGEVQW